VSLGEVTARGVVFSLPNRAIVAGKLLRIGISADARGLRLDLARLGSTPSVLARRTHAPAAVVAIPASTPGGLYVVSNRHAGRTYEALLAVRGAQPARVALVVARPTAAAAAYQRKLDALGIPFDVLTERDVERGLTRGYKALVVPPDAGEAHPVVVESPDAVVVRTLAGIKPGLGQ
jgi:hypothetical protein